MKGLRSGFIKIDCLHDYSINLLSHIYKFAFNLETTIFRTTIYCSPGVRIDPRLKNKNKVQYDHSFVMK
jgi:hypothetical protein